LIQNHIPDLVAEVTSNALGIHTIHVYRIYSIGILDRSSRNMATRTIASGARKIQLISRAIIWCIGIGWYWKASVIPTIYISGYWTDVPRDVCAQVHRQKSWILRRVCMGVLLPLIEGEVRSRIVWLRMAVLAIVCVASLGESTDPSIIVIVFGCMGQ